MYYIIHRNRVVAVTFTEFDAVCIAAIAEEYQKEYFNRAPFDKGREHYIEFNYATINN